MADSLTKKGPADRLRINVNEDWELRWWCKALKITPEELRATVKKVGVMAADVRAALGK